MGKLKKIINYLVFQYLMLKMNHELLKTKSTIRKTEANDLMIVHFNPEMNSVENFIPVLEKSVSDPYKALNGHPPMVLVMPFGMQFSSINWDNFAEMLTYDQKKALRNALIRKQDLKIVTA